MLFKKPVEVAIETEEPEIEAPKHEEPQKFTPIEKTTIGPGITFVGDFVTTDPIVINGAIDGDINSSETVEINQTGAYNGNANVKNLLLHGSVDGKLKVEDLSKLTSTAVMHGTLSTSKLITEEGSSFEGDMKLFQLKPVPQKEAAPEAEPKEEPKAASKEEATLPLLKEDDVEADEDFIFGKH